MKFSWNECFKGIVNISELHALLETCSFEVIPSTIVNVTISFVGSKRLTTTCHIFMYQPRPIKAWTLLAARSDITFLTNEENRLEISWDENILLAIGKKIGMKRESPALVIRAKHISNNCKKITDVIIIAVRLLLRTNLIIAKCVILCGSFDYWIGSVVFSLRHKELMILTKQIIFSVVGKVKPEDNSSISMRVIHPSLGEMSMSILFCSDGNNHIADVRNMLVGTAFSGFTSKPSTNIVSQSFSS